MKHTTFSADSRIKVLLVLIALAALLITGFVFVTKKHRWGLEKLAEVEPKHARLQGLLMKEMELTALATEANAQLSQLVYPAADDATKAGNTAQQRIRDIFTKAGLEVVGTQVLATKSEKQFERIPISVRLEGDLASLNSSLMVLKQERPIVMIENLLVQPAGAAKAGTQIRLGIQISAFVVRVKK